LLYLDRLLLHLIDLETGHASTPHCLQGERIAVQLKKTSTPVETTPESLACHSAAMEL
jgi:hypothetical protein